MEWLGAYAYKAEERIDADPALAHKVYFKLARRLIQSGTGAALLFGTINEESNLILAEEFQNAGIRGFVGKLSMDKSSRPSYVEKSAEASLASAKSFISRCNHLVSDLHPYQRLVEPVITPRFVPTCSNELLEGLGNLAQTSGAKVQSHMAEARDMVDWVRAERQTDDFEIFQQVCCPGKCTSRFSQASGV
ncbi:atrazine chlorohydrolase/guanine deaminase [Clavulina sp. PMI_390]|nr:atrazine chlorohydrolase/guanine deaminase [Clavulina sp. PMI_390]